MTLHLHRVTTDIIHDAETGLWSYLVEGLDDDVLTILSFEDRARAEQSLLAMRQGNANFARAGAQIAHAGHL